MRKLTDLKGKKIGKLHVIEYCKDYVNSKGTSYPMWKCLCDCQLSLPTEDRKYSYFPTSALVQNKVHSCGCFRKEMSKKYNKFDLSGEYGIGYLDNGDKFIFDKEDYDLIKDKWWVIDKDGYVICKNDNLPHGKSSIRLSRLVMNCYDDNKVDHINHDIKDNRKSNLRIVSSSQNGMNRKLNSNNTSGISGVHWNKGEEKWIARIGVDGKRIHLGSYDSFEDAVTARKTAEDKYFGEFSYDNSVKKE